MSCWDSQHVLTPHTHTCRGQYGWHWQNSMSPIVFLRIRFISNMHIRSWQVFVFYYDLSLHSTVWFLSIALAFTPQLIRLLIRCFLLNSHFTFLMSFASHFFRPRSINIVNLQLFYIWVSRIDMQCEFQCKMHEISMNWFEYKWSSIQQFHTLTY